MIFIVCIIIGIVGIILTLLLARKKPEFVNKQSSWLDVHPEVWEFHISTFIADTFRELMKEIIVWLLVQYRVISKKITIKQMVKERVRAFLSETPSENPVPPSEFWSQVKDTKEDTHLPPQ